MMSLQAFLDRGDDLVAQHQVAAVADHHVDLALGSAILTPSPPAIS